MIFVFQFCLILIFFYIFVLLIARKAGVKLSTINSQKRQETVSNQENIPIAPTKRRIFTLANILRVGFILIIIMIIVKPEIINILLNAHENLIARFGDLYLSIYLLFLYFLVIAFFLMINRWDPVKKGCLEIGRYFFTFLLAVVCGENILNPLIHQSQTGNATLVQLSIRPVVILIFLLIGWIWTRINREIHKQPQQNSWFSRWISGIGDFQQLHPKLSYFIVEPALLFCAMYLGIILIAFIFSIIAKI